MVQNTVAAYARWLDVPRRAVFLPRMEFGEPLGGKWKKVETGGHGSIMLKTTSLLLWMTGVFSKLLLNILPCRLTWNLK